MPAAASRLCKQAVQKLVSISVRTPHLVSVVSFFLSLHDLLRPPTESAAAARQEQTRPRKPSKEIFHKEHRKTMCRLHQPRQDQPALGQLKWPFLVPCALSVLRLAEPLWCPNSRVVRCSRRSRGGSRRNIMVYPPISMCVAPDLCRLAAQAGSLLSSSPSDGNHTTWVALA